MVQLITPFNNELYSRLSQIQYEMMNLAERIGFNRDQNQILAEISACMHDLFAIANPTYLYFDFEDPQEAVERHGMHDSSTQLKSYTTVICAICYRLLPRNDDESERERRALFILDELYAIVTAALLPRSPPMRGQTSLSRQSDVNSVD